MPCFHPVPAWKPLPGSKRKKLFFRQAADSGERIDVPCGQCLGCRMGKSQDWQTRLTHEASQHERSAFITLTFRDEDLPPDMSVSVRDVQLFLKRLRKKVGPVRFFACGEYGDVKHRPHYHLLVFGYEFPDRKPWRKTQSGFVVDRSDILDALWPFGHAEVGTVTPLSAGYVARYCLKKVTGDAAEAHYTRLNPETGELLRVRPEFICMSRRPGIGGEWYEKYHMDAFPSDFVVIDGARKPIPQYYTRKLAAKSEAEVAAVKDKRKERAEKHSANQTPERLATREEVLRLRALNLKRELDTEQ